MVREDSGESVESIGDLPIELPHLEGDLGVDHQMLWLVFNTRHQKRLFLEQYYEYFSRLSPSKILLIAEGFVIF